jgi:hypothetical protein
VQFLVRFKYFWEVDNVPGLQALDVIILLLAILGFACFGLMGISNYASDTMLHVVTVNCFNLTALVMFLLDAVHSAIAPISPLLWKFRVCLVVLMIISAYTFLCFYALAHQVSLRTVGTLKYLKSTIYLLEFDLAIKLSLYLSIYLSI